jgi:hypothetical protein
MVLRLILATDLAHKPGFLSSPRGRGLPPKIQVANGDELPNRILRDGIIESERVNRLSPGAELFYRRLMSKADDFGRFHANLNLLLAACYPMQLDRVSLTNVREWLTECGEAPSLVREYLIEGKNYLEIINFQQRTRSNVSKFPDPPQSHDRAPLTIDRESRETAARASNTSPSPNNVSELRTTSPNADTFESRFTIAWDRHKKHRGGVTRQMVCQRLLSVDWDVWDARHVPFCEFWDRIGWTTCAVTMLEWFENGMPLPPPQVVKKSVARRDDGLDDVFREAHE